ncbi:Helix-turn-helix [Kushneria avicenniae]|uniref:Helix-turn-helix n=1 Tax=Kushneria avicenniae TaxID=402385 RepID=A0A1I1JJ27_9GAMM|nr:dynamin family protein [Kushneria avicenniae]SFC48619.1 Helix-turn-helix [Kushneria avicenniae]
MDTNLEGLRKAAGISQAEMASYLEISQSQVSRYEKDPDEVPLKIFRKWQAFCGHISSNRSLDLGEHDPMAEIDNRIELINDYLDAHPIPPSDFSMDHLERDSDVASIDHLRETISRVGRKPRVGLFGRFDMGKSRLANMLMGGDSLPAQYQPTTSIACLIRHMDDKPEWQPENVWIMDSGFDLDRPDDEKHCNAHRLVGGGYEALSDHGTHSKNGVKHTRKDAAAAIVYVRSDFLKGCDLIDLPGYQNHEDDDQRAEMAQRIADVIIYVSLAAGFMNEQDRGYLAQLTRHLPAFETPMNGLPPLRNLMVVATRADIAGNEPNKLLEMACRNTFDGIGETLQDRGEQLGVSLSRDDFLNRFFTYSADSPSFRKDFENDLVELLADIAPQRILENLDRIVRDAKASNARSCDGIIESITGRLDNRERAQQEIKSVLDNEDERIERKNEHESKVLRLIESLKRESLLEASNIYRKHTDVDYIENIIKHRYENKKQAKELAPTYIVEQIQRALDNNLKKKAERLRIEVDSFLDQYQTAIGKDSNLNDSWNFNAKGAFIGALAGFGTFGALATWASVVAAGSNLGGYILAAKIVSMLSSIGISLGGTGTVMSLISLLGGPITIAVGIGIAVGAVIAFIAGDSWERSLAKRIAKGLDKENAMGVITKQLNGFWDDTKKAFEHAASETEKDFKKKLKSLSHIAFNTNVEILKEHLVFVRELRDFFAGIPWKSIQ